MPGESAHSEPAAARQCRTISAIADAMNPAAKWQNVVHSILRAIVDNLGYKGALVRLVDAERRTLVLTGAFGLSDTYLDRGPVEIEKSGLDREVLAGSVVDIADASSDPRYQFHHQAAAEGIGSLLAAPLALRDRVIGVLRVFSAESRTANDQEKHFLQAAARLTARALIETQHMEALRNISVQISSSVGLQEVLTAILRRTVDELNYKGGIIRLLDSTGRRLELVAATGLSQAYLNKGEVAIERSAIDQTVLGGEPVTITDVAAGIDFQYPREVLEEGIQSVHAMPPSSVPKESGINSFEERIRVCRAMLVKPGRSTDAEAMLFITRESVAEAAMVKAINLPSLLPAARRRYLPIQAAMPVFVTPAVTRKTAAIVTTAGLPNPASASAASSVPLRISAMTVNIATTSGPYLPVMNMITAPTRMPRTTPISRLIVLEHRIYGPGRQEVSRVAITIATVTAKNGISC